MILKLLTFAALCLPLCSARPGKPGANDIEAAAATTKGKGRMSSEGDGISALSLEPSYPPGAGTTPYCTYWIDYEGYETCQDITDFWKITMDDFMRWNPSVNSQCEGLNAELSYCIEATLEPAPPPVPTPEPSTSTSSAITTTNLLPSSTQKTTTARTSTSSPSQTTSKATNPTPTQPGMVANCDSFYFVKAGDKCAQIAAAHGISGAEFLTWNPLVGDDCTGLWADVYVCVSVTGHTPSAPSPTTPGNGIATPVPTQPGMVNNCNAFHLIKSGDLCNTIIAKYGISSSQFLAWNPTTGATCTGLWADAYVCVSIIGNTPSNPTATTTVIDGTSFPLPAFPTQPGTVAKCNRWHKVVSGNTCASIASTYDIARSQLNFWNKGINIDCSNLWLNSSVCTASAELVSYWTPNGCYSDSASSRVLANRISTQNEATIMSPKVCQDACKAAGYRYAGVESGSECWCDNSIKNGHTAGQSGCTTPCPGKPKSHVCGGIDRISVYKLDKYEDLGCFADSQTSRSLTIQITGIAGMTRRICQVSCEKKGYRLSGVELGSQCFCDDTNAGTSASSGCNTPCVGNSGEMCGGSDRINVMRHPTSRSVGCWSDNDTPNMRSLKYQQVIPNAHTLMTPGLCRNTCRSLGFLFSGVEFGRDCFCDDKIHSGQATTGCSTPCPGNPSLMCGGGLRLNIYEN